MGWSASSTISTKFLSGETPEMIRPLSGEDFFKAAIEFVPMAMPFGNHRRLIDPVGERTRLQIGRISAQPHRAADRVDAQQVAQFVDDRIWRVRLELRAVGVLQTADVCAYSITAHCMPRQMPKYGTFSSRAN